MKKTLLILGLAFFAVQLNAQTISASDVLMYLDFEDDFVDSAGNFAFSIRDGAATDVTYNVSGKFGKSVAFPGAGGSAYTSTSASNGTFENSNSHTIAFWIKVPALPTSNNDFLHQFAGDGTNSRVHFRYGSAKFSSFGNGSASLVENNPAVTANTWHHIVIRLDVEGEAKRKLFLDGTQIATNPLNDPYDKTGSGIITVGSNNADSNVVNGEIDDLLITSEVLSDAQITQIMTNGVQASLDGALSVSSVKNDSSVKVFVNNDILTYQTPSKVNSSEIYSITGQKLIDIKNASNNQIDVKQLSTGIYILRLSSEDKVSTKKFVVN
ncbi:LamG-like jellyroll fold domain-containing protein [uncultured Algibacter sp.]|uniref:LamG-like jellyroll fold domain-containing protein n=1 Tax=uncultured Algibacter sp. TaxID=298659 RepID=UPI00261737ED|nr:LamG-like jellyroll fold domain-containing protein [uncultured Algibacter sp.]